MKIRALVLSCFVVSCQSAIPDQQVLDEVFAPDLFASSGGDDGSLAALPQDPVEEAPQDKKKSAAEIAKELANPTSAVGSLNFNFDHTRYDGDLNGAGTQYATSLLVQPSLPYPLEDGSRLFLRPAIPILFDQPVFDSATGQFDKVDVQIGDTGYDIGYGGTNKSGWLALGGLVGTIPTATDKRVGKSQWAIGPELLVGKIEKWGVVGALVTHQWDFASTSSGAKEVNVTGGQYFYSVFLGNGWTLTGSPTFSYDHEASSGNRLAFPLGTGFSKTTELGGRPWKFGLQAWYYLESPDSFGPEWLIRFTMTPVVALPW